MNKKNKGTLILAALTCSMIISAQTLTSPNGNYQMNFSLSGDGSPLYTLNYKGKEVIKPSKMGLELKSEGINRDFDDFSPEGVSIEQKEARTSLYNNFSIVNFFC